MRKKGISFSGIIIIIIVLCVLFFIGVKLFRITGDTEKYIKYVKSFSTAVESYSKKYLTDGEHKFEFDKLKNELVSNKYLNEYEDSSVIISSSEIIIKKDGDEITYYNYSNDVTFENGFELNFVKDGKTFNCTKTECK